MNPRDIILDTDIGDNVDDAWALALALASPEVNLRGVTTSTRIADGTSKPLLEPYDFQLGAQFQILEDDVWQSCERAVDFLIEAARVDEEPENLLTVVCVGPLTNLALALAVEPELISRLKIVMMGGCLGEARRETNIKSDPEAAAMVFNSGVAIRMVPSCVSRQMQLEESHLAQLQNSTSLYAKSLAQLTQIWMDETGKLPILHDALALLSLWSDGMRWEEKCVQVELCGETRGLTTETGGEPNALVAVEVDAPRALNEILSRIF
jgi:purine nucleosidase